MIVRPTEKGEILFFQRQIVVIKSWNFVAAISKLVNLFGQITFTRKEISTALNFDYRVCPSDRCRCVLFIVLLNYATVHTAK